MYLSFARLICLGSFSLLGLLGDKLLQFNQLQQTVMNGYTKKWRQIETFFFSLSVSSCDPYNVVRRR